MTQAMSVSKQVEDTACPALTSKGKALLHSPSHSQYMGRLSETGCEMQVRDQGPHLVRVLVSGVRLSCGVTAF